MTTRIGLFTALVLTLPACGSSPDDDPEDTNESSAAASCTGHVLPPIADYGEPGPFTPTTVTETGPDGQYTLVRPADLGEGGFLHPVAAWGNGITTRPEHYAGLLDAIASHGFVIVASNSTTVNATLMTAGLDWLVAQNDAPGDFQNKLATDCGLAIGYSLGGGAAVDMGDHPSVVTTVSFHGLEGTAENLAGPLFLITSTNDGFVTKSEFVRPTFDRSTQAPTLMATLEVPGAVPDFAGHLIPLGDANDERAPAIAWIRHFVYGDEGGREWFYGDDCVVCSAPWIDLQRKNGDW